MVIQLSDDVYVSVLGTAIMVGIPFLLFLAYLAKPPITNEDLHDDLVEIKDMINRLGK